MSDADSCSRVMNLTSRRGARVIFDFVGSNAAVVLTAGVSQLAPNWPYRSAVSDRIRPKSARWRRKAG